MPDMKLHRDNGLVVGVVVDLDDPGRLGRVMVEYPWLEGQVSGWARLVVPMAGPERGFHFRPEVGDEVMVAFERGEPRRPYVLGALWSKVDPPPADDGDHPANNWRFIVSRSGHVFKLDDTPGAERIEIIDKDGQRKVIVDSSGSKIQILCETGDIEVTATTGNVSVEGVQVDVKAKANMNLEATGVMTIKGSVVNIN